MMGPSRKSNKNSAKCRSENEKDEEKVVKSVIGPVTYLARYCTSQRSEGQNCFCRSETEQATENDVLAVAISCQNEFINLIKMVVIYYK